MQPRHSHIQTINSTIRLSSLNLSNDPAIFILKCLCNDQLKSILVNKEEVNLREGDEAYLIQSNSFSIYSYSKD